MSKTFHNSLGRYYFSKGKFFIGYQGKGTTLNPATLFRNFKEAALEIELDQNFTPKTLMIND